MSRTRTILILLFVLCVAVAYAWVATPKQRRVSTTQKKSATVDVSVQQVNISGPPDVVDLDFSGRQTRSYEKPLKNPFGALYLPPKQVKKRPPPPPPKVKKLIPKPKVVAPIKIKPRGPAPIPPLNILGYLNKAGEITVFLSSPDGDIHLLKQDDTFADGLVVKRVDTEEITIAHKQTGQQVVLKMEKTKSQRLPGLKMVSDRPKFTLPSPDTKGRKPAAGGTGQSLINKTEKNGEN